jgi:predicted metalloprotease with PDZ domain
MAGGTALAGRGHSLAALVLAGLSAAFVAVRASETITYTLTPQSDQGRLRVELLWETEGRTESALSVSPQWGTLADVPAILRNMTWEGATDVRREGATWIVRHARGAELAARYDVQPPDRTFDWPRTHHPITSAHFFHGIGNAFLLVPQSARGAPERDVDALLHWRIPRTWKALCSWGVGTSVGARVKPSDVRNALYAAGEFQVASHERPGLSLDVATARGCGFSAEALGVLAADIVRGQCAFMKETDFPRFVVCAIPVGPPLKSGDTRLAGTGLYHSFALFVPPSSRLDDGVEHLFAHELFHHWNGRLLAAAQPERLVFWFVEGFTDYYALRILFESQRWSARTYADWLNRHLRDYAANPAQRATNQQILERFWSERETYGEVAYQRGLLLGLRWHYLARQRGVPDGVDRWVLTLLREGREHGLQVSNDVLQSRAVELLGPWMREEFERFVTAAEPVPVPPDALLPALTGASTPVYEYQLGFDRAGSLAQRRVRGLIPASAAELAGLREGDELAGWVLDSNPDHEVRLDIVRGNTARTVRYYPRGAARVVLQFSPAEADDERTSSRPADENTK